MFRDDVQREIEGNNFRKNTEFSANALNKQQTSIQHGKDNKKLTLTDFVVK